jgi:hypothetical protein
MPESGRLSGATGFTAAAEGMSTDVRNCTFRPPPPHLRGCEERRQAIAQTADKAGRTRNLLARHRIECPVATDAGTFEFESASGVYTELQ